MVIPVFPYLGPQKTQEEAIEEDHQEYFKLPMGGVLQQTPEGFMFTHVCTLELHD